MESPKSAEPTQPNTGIRAVRPSAQTNSIARRVTIGLFLAIGAAGAIATSKTEASPSATHDVYPLLEREISPMDKAMKECKHGGSIRNVKRIPTCFPLEKNNNKIKDTKPQPLRPKTDFQLQYPIFEYEQKFVGKESV